MEIVYQNNDFVVIIKPVNKDSEKEVPELLKEQLSSEIYTLHRLDKNVGGLMVYAKNKKAAALLSKEISEQKMIKEYIAMVEGDVEEEGIFEDYLFKDSRKNKVFVVKSERKGVKYAKLSYKRLNSTSPSLVRVHLYTGRSHQIRVQFASRKHPLIGDKRYGSKSDIKDPMLYSCYISFHYKNEQYEFESIPDWAKA